MVHLLFIRSLSLTSEYATSKENRVVTSLRERNEATTSQGAAALAPVPDGLRRELQELGLRPYEARVLLALLHAGSANSAQLAELSGVPRTSTYQVMEGLTDQGLAERVPTHGPAMWTSQGWESVVDVLDRAEEERLRLHHERTMRLRQVLAEALPAKAAVAV